MRDMERLCSVIEDELVKIADKGLNTNNLETAYKLIDMYKDMKNTKYWDKKCEYYDAVLDEMQGGYSEAAYSRGGDYSERRDSRGRYSRDDGYGRGNSYANRGQHWVRGHYSRADGGDAYDDYMMQKQSYRNSGKSEDCKHRMLDALQKHLDMLTQEIGDMGADAECREEREMIKNYMQKLQNMM